jgi:hypothetical protein
MVPVAEANFWVQAASYALDNIVAIGTLLGVVVSIAVLFEMRKQRRQTYQPNLFLQNQHFWLETNSNGTPCFMKPLADENKHFYGPPYYLKIENIGLGAAHSIRVAWKYDAKRIRKELDRLGSSTKRVVNDYGTHFQYLFSESGKTGYGFMIDDPPLEEEIVSFLKSGESYQLPLPESIKNYITFIPYLKLMKDKFPHSIEERTERFSVEFVMYDISGRRRRSRVFLYLNVVAFGKEDHAGNYAVGSFSFGTRRLVGEIVARRKREDNQLLSAASNVRENSDSQDQ